MFTVPGHRTLLSRFQEILIGPKSECFGLFFDCETGSACIITKNAFLFKNNRRFMHDYAGFYSLTGQALAFSRRERQKKSGAQARTSTARA